MLSSHYHKVKHCQAELPILSQNWFYALKKHALLSLPQGKTLSRQSNLPAVRTGSTLSKIMLSSHYHTVKHCQAELPTLSQNWFYALKKHALLSLPHGKTLFRRVTYPHSELVLHSQRSCSPLTTTRSQGKTLSRKGYLPSVRTGSTLSKDHALFSLPQGKTLSGVEIHGL